MIGGHLLVTAGKLPLHMICVEGRNKPAVLWTCSTEHMLSQASPPASQPATGGQCENKTFFTLCLLLLCALAPCLTLLTWPTLWDLKDHSVDWVSPSAQAGHPQQHQPCLEVAEETHWVLHHPGGAAKVSLSCAGGPAVWTLQVARGTMTAIVNTWGPNMPPAEAKTAFTLQNLWCQCVHDTIDEGLKRQKKRGNRGTSMPWRDTSE